jgi:pimeloyl-ACP methyl ester carboxylesterase
MGLRAPAAIVLALALALPAAGCAGSAASTGPGAASQPASGGWLDAGGTASPGGTVSPGSTPGPGTGTGTGTGPAPPVSQLCGPPAGPGQLTSIRAADGVRLAAVSAGSGRRGVVLIPELGPRGKCGWWDFAVYLAQHGYHALLFDHRCTGESACPGGQAANELMPDIQGAVTWLRHQGAARVALVGASQGGSEALIAAVRPPRGVAGIVALSADELTTPLASRPYPGTASGAVARLRLPTLFAVARADPSVSVAATRHLFARAGSRHKQLIVLGDQAGHGWDLVSAGFTGDARPALCGTVLAYLHGITS